MEKSACTIHNFCKYIVLNYQVLIPISFFFKDTLIAARTGPPYTATTTINVNIIDADNRPPWFQPCTQYEYAGGLVCQSSGYTGKVDLNEQVVRHFPCGNTLSIKLSIYTEPPGNKSSDFYTTGIF